MSQNYQRYQIILTETSPEFSVHGKKAFGKCMLEARGETGKVNFSIQNLKPGIICNAYIVAAGNDTNLAIHIGKILSNAAGNAEIKWECNANNVDESGLSLKAFNVAGVMIFGENVVNAPIMGYRDSEIMWKNNLRVHNKQTSRTEDVTCEC